jgi:choline dehydrogenase-like flavoprotein
VQSLSCSSKTADQKPATQFTVIADRYVLALGAVANARQLLIAKVPNDNIGRYFMCHPLVQSYMDGKPNPITISKPFLSPQQRQLLSGHTSLDPNSGWTGKNGVTVNGRFSPSADLQKSKQIGSIWFWGDSSQGLYFEQAPNKNSRVTLSVNKDKVWEQPQTHIDWQFCDADESTYTQNIEAYQKSAQLLNPATQIKGAPWKDIKSRVVVNGHHLGTTRMSETAADGVVDKNLRSHDLNNLYVAGSSVWRTACIPNPTFSIITFSLRLADHLKQSLKQGNAAKPELDSIAAD